MPRNLPVSRAVREESPICQYTIFQVEDLQNQRDCILATTNALRKQFNCLNLQLKNLPQRGNCHVRDTKPVQRFTSRFTTALCTSTCQTEPVFGVRSQVLLWPIPTSFVLVQEVKWRKGIFLQRNPEVLYIGLIPRGAKTRSSGISKGE